MAQGILAGRFVGRPAFAEGDHRRGHRLFQPEIYPRVQNALEELKPIAERRRISLAQLALAWIISHPNVCAIAGARSAAQSAENAAAAGLTLSEGELAAMDAISRSVTGQLDDNPVQWNF
jgi:aryl-alcohol dehydrogenase-like predicted oxidoreductase